MTIPPSGYAIRVVALLDIMGASTALRTPERARRFSEAVAAVMSPILRDKGEPWLVVPHAVTGEEVEIQPSLPVNSEAQVTTISDSIVVSVPCPEYLDPAERLRRVFDCLQCVFWLQRSLLCLGFKTRGGLALGGLIHEPELVIGEALLRVHELEHREARNPRVLIDDPVIDLLIAGPFPSIALFQNRVAHLVRCDADGRYFVDYLSHDPVLGGFNLGAHIGDIIRAVWAEKDAVTDAGIEEKLDWMIRYFQITAAAYKEAAPRVSHADPRFTAVYPRTSDNLSTWAADLLGPDWNKGPAR